MGVETPYTHDLVLLYNLSEKYRPSYVSIFSSCTIVTQFSVQLRYDRRLSISDDDIKLVLTHTKIIRDFFKKGIFGIIQLKTQCLKIPNNNFFAEFFFQ